MSAEYNDFTVDDLRRLHRELAEARYSGLKRVQFDDREIVYRDDKEMQAALSTIENLIDRKAGRLRRRAGTVRSSFRRG